MLIVMRVIRRLDSRIISLYCMKVLSRIHFGFVRINIVYKECKVYKTMLVLVAMAKHLENIIKTEINLLAQHS